MNRSITFASLVIALTLLGCGSSGSRDAANARVELNAPKTETFLVKVNAIQPGTKPDVVRKELGNPDEMRRSAITYQREPGPAEALKDLAPVGTKYEEWTYKRGDSHYHLFFTRHAGEWQLLTSRSTSKNAVNP